MEPLFVAGKISPWKNESVLFH